MDLNKWWIRCQRAVLAPPAPRAHTSAPARRAAREEFAVRILLLSQNYPPEASSAAQKVSEMAEFLSSRGHAVTVLTAFPNYPTGVVFDGYRRKLRQVEQIGTIKVVRSWLHVTRARDRFAPRLLSYVSFAASALVAGVPLGRQDVVYVYAPPTFLVPTAQVLARLLRAALVVDIHDLWPDAPIHLGFVKHPAAVALARGFERWTYAAPDRILSYSRTHLRKLAEKGVPEAKLGLVPLWIDSARFAPAQGDAPKELRDRHGFGDRFVVAYTGNLGIPQGLDTVLAAAARLQADGDDRIHFALVGGGAERDRLVADAARQGLRNVTFVPPQPMAAMPDWMAAADALVLHLDHAPFREGTVPGKLFYYMASGRPVLAAAIGETADIVRDHDCGLSLPPRDPAALAAAARELASDPQRRLAMGRNGRRAAVEVFDRARLLVQMESELANAAVAAGARSRTQR